MATRPKVSVKASESQQVDAYISRSEHPLAHIVEALRQAILTAHSDIGEEIKWNVPAFFYTGPMGAFNPKEYKRHIVVFNLHRKDCIRLVFPSGSRIEDKSGLLEGDFSDGRRLASFSSTAEVHSKKHALQEAVRNWLELLDRG